MLERAAAEQAFRRAVAVLGLYRRIGWALLRVPSPAGRRLGIAAGKAAIAMARSAFVDDGIAVAPEHGAAPGPGWRVMDAAHPAPDERSVAAGRAVRDLVERATPDDLVIALISGGASSLIEQPRVPLDELRAITDAVMAAGASIRELNTVRGALSEIKAGQLALACRAPIITLVASDVVGDPLDVVGSGPTIVPAHSLDAQRRAALAILERCGVAAPDALAAPIDHPAAHGARTGDHAVLVTPLSEFADTVISRLAITARRLDPPLEGDVAAVARALVEQAGPFVAWGEPTLRLPADHGDGGRAQQLALALAGLVRGTDRSFFVAGTDGIDGPRPRDGRPSPAGAFVDGATWDAIRAAGVDPELALARCDAGPALAAIGALFAPGPTGVNYADVVIAG